MKKIVLGLSGGVDSAVAGRLLQQQGYEVFGLYLDIVPNGVQDAQAVADFLGISLYVADISKELDALVCRPFVAAYLRGETPNPCVNCNPLVKFKTLLDYADSIGAGQVATGHYAIIRNGGLYKGNPANDQSYMLCQVRREQVARMLLPLGQYPKSEVRAMAEQFDLPVAHKPDSMEICFIPDGDFGAYIERTGKAPGPGNFVDTHGNVLGQHKGIHRYTLGQRRGLGIAAGKRVFVSEIRPETNEVVLSDGDELYVQEIRCGNVNWLIDTPDAPFSAAVRVRHSKGQDAARVIPGDSQLRIVFDTPVRAPTPGQAACVYVENRVVCGAKIL